MTLHALRNIQKDEEITIYYLQESVYLDKTERASKLGT